MEIDYSKILTQADCAEAMRKVMADKDMRNGDKSRAMQSLETLSKTIASAYLEEERRGNEQKTAISKVVIEFVVPDEKQLERVDEIDRKLLERERKENSGNA